ncbi:ABC transporter ATP-binding protein/permease [Propioniferax innocua]|uniref:ABC-type multidrug transport system fused ATPase/permease subunit n=1 Tax=Propioniferax innocua TaxID=1753 RepID=A0A542ZCY0_9ACTN|nr:ABC-type multidrug transport system fused ATPase/permease subunit [Propioniferax innocua]
MSGPDAGGLPPLFTGVRRAWLAVLVVLGLGQAAIGMAMAWAMIRLQESVDPSTSRWALLTMVLAAFAVGALRVNERVVAERLGQHYVREVRRELLRSVLTPGDSSSLGITVARTTNDLTSVRNWVAQGVAPMVVAVPLIAGVLVALTLLDWRLAAVALVPLALLAAGLMFWAREAYAKSRALRRTRGAMASRIAETVTASDAILAAGGGHRELRNLDEVSARVADRAVDRAGTLGLIRATGVVASTLVGMLVAAVGTLGHVDAAVIVAAMAIAAIAAPPIMDLGRVVEFRQSFLAARAVLAPTLQHAALRRAARVEHRDRSSELTVPDTDALVHIQLPELLERAVIARGGNRYVLQGDPAATELAVNRILGLALPPGHLTDHVRIAGLNIAEAESRETRELVGVARAGTAFERGRLLRAARYRRPDLDADAARDLLYRVGLPDSSLPEGHRTQLRRGGSPLTVDQRARLSLARALYGEPELLILDRIENDLSSSGKDMLVDLVCEYPGVVLLIGCEHVCAALDPEPVSVMHVDGDVRTDPTDWAEDEDASRPAASPHRAG